MAIYYDDDLTLPQVDGPPVWSWPLLEDGDAVTRMFMQSYQLRVGYLRDHQPVLDDPTFVDGDTFYLVGQSPAQPIGADVVRFTRTFVMLPETRDVPEQMSYTFRGLASDQQYPYRTVSSAATAAGSTTITTSVAHGIVAGDSVAIFCSNTQGSSQLTVAYNVRRTALAGTTGATLVVQAIIPPSGTLQYNSVRKVDDGREPRTEPVTAFSVYEYFLPGVSPNISKASDIEQLEPERIVDNTGQETLTYGDTSLPTRTSYLSQVAAKSKVVAEFSRISRWKGNIHERATRYVIAA